MKVLILFMIIGWFDNGLLTAETTLKGGPVPLGKADCG